MEKHEQFNKEVARRTKKEDWVKSQAHIADDFDLPAIWEALQEPKPEKEKSK